MPVEAGALRADIERYTAPTGQGFDVRQKVPRLIPSSGAVPRRAFEPPGRGSQLPNIVGRRGENPGHQRRQRSEGAALLCKVFVVIVRPPDSRRDVPQAAFAMVVRPAPSS